MTTGQPPETMGALIRETFRAMVARVEHQFDDSDLALSQWLALKLIGAGDIACIGDVNRELGLESGAATRLVDQLENRHLLQRRRSMTDRRVVGIELTQDGAAVIEAMQPRLAAFWREQLGIFSEAEQDMLFAMLSRLRDRLSSETTGEPGRTGTCV